MLKRIAEIEGIYERYKREVADTFKSAEAVKTIDSSAEMNVLRKTLAISRTVSMELQKKGNELSEGLNQNIIRISAEATEECLDPRGRRCRATSP